MPTPLKANITKATVSITKDNTKEAINILFRYLRSHL